ncbi:ketosteroid isomerase-like protein [Kribbella voronezhensis]|uniref:Ketosteroid isomerase-like protein n=1 Tax=Kribbella voronezhensis TaxID=2512212 RepID=A0A4R7TE72_9ACTN|nr:nuclear transport factor 2 family protein [Kribbella voronezhensis]TDU90079.1 ketosteroid isomerase-like protein [Kribbella voronezhensis]
MTTEQTRTVVREYFDRMIARDWEAFGQLVSDDVVYELPQTGERITGRDRFVQFNREYPGDWQITVTRLIADGSAAAGSMNFTVGDEQLVGLVYFEVPDGVITRITDFWPEPYEAPPGREHLVELGAVGLDRLRTP